MEINNMNDFYYKRYQLASSLKQNKKKSLLNCMTMNQQQSHALTYGVHHGLSFPCQAANES